MALRKYNPVTAGTRWRIGNAYAEITTNVPEKTLLESISGTGGRNVQGRRSMRYIGGGNKKMYRIIDFKRNKFDIPATVKTIEYDPNRTANIALLFYADGEKRYIIAPTGLKVGDVIVQIDPSYFRPTEVETLLGDPAKAKAKLGWVPEITVQQMCAEMVAADLDEAKRHSLLKDNGFKVNISLE